MAQAREYMYTQAGDMEYTSEGLRGETTWQTWAKVSNELRYIQRLRKTRRARERERVQADWRCDQFLWHRQVERHYTSATVHDGFRFGDHARPPFFLLIQRRRRLPGLLSQCVMSRRRESSGSSSKESKGKADDDRPPSASPLFSPRAIVKRPKRTQETW